MNRYIKFNRIWFRLVTVSLLFNLIVILNSCDEKEFLKEVPLDFYSPENSFITFENFESAILNLYYRVRADFYMSEEPRGFPSLAWSGTELIYSHVNLAIPQPNWEALLLPTNTGVVYDGAWKPCYKLIFDANVIIERADSEQNQLTEDQKNKIKAEASFFRAFAYKNLANLYGGVPLLLEETKTPKRDFVRASRQAVYEQCVSDFKFAAENLPGIDEVDDSRISNLTAFHFLAEVYISLNRWTEAITAASTVIEDPAVELMTQRFGTKSAQPGDVYSDLFQQNNQNRSSGNTEAIWVLQYEYLIPGGADGFNLERMLVPRLWRAKIKNTNGSTSSVTPYPNSFYYGRGSGQIRPSHYFFEKIWEKSGYDQDMRNSEYNIVRDFIINNPSSSYNGKWIIGDNVPIALKSWEDTTRNFFPVVAKASTPGDHPKELWLPDQTVPGSLSSEAGLTFRDQYVVRLAETYLLRAEAYLGNNDKINSAADINVVRGRAQAPQIDPSLVDLDYILDERLRELYFEELRLLTLTRLGKLVERTKACNPWVGNSYSSHNNLWPIPYNEIEKNTEAVLEQNPDY